jgi:4-hydroxy-tetrahydrodipicolinate synthase
MTIVRLSKETRSLSEETRGVFPLCPTPFHDDGSLDMASLERVLDFFLEKGAHGLVVLGVFGEAARLSAEESRRVLRRVMKHVGRAVPVVVGAGTLGLEALKALAGEAMDAGAAGMMLAPAPELESDDLIRRNMAQALDAVGTGVPVILRDFPPANNVHLSVPLILRLIADHRQIVALKNDDFPNLGKQTLLRAEAKAAGLRRFAILAGRGGFFLPQGLARGADGVACGYTYPEMLVGVYKRCRAGDLDGAMDLYNLHLPLIRHEAQPGLGLSVRKYVLYRRGILASPLARPPAPMLGAADRAEIHALMGRIETRD